MKTTTKEFESVQVFRDMAHETKTRQEIEVSRSYMQAILNEWNQFEFGKVSDIMLLLMRPEQLFNKTLERLVEAPETGSRFKMKKSAYMDTLVLPDPSDLYRACNVAKKQTWCAVPLWKVSDDGKTVEVDQEAAKPYIDTFSIYAATPEKVKLAKDIQAFCDLWSDLNARLNGELLDCRDSFLNRWTMGKFKVTQKQSDSARIEPDRDVLKRWLGA